MGVLKILSGSSFDRRSCSVAKPYIPEPPNPNPYNYEILDSEQIGNWLIIKILLYYMTTLARLLDQRSIDPHFSNSTKISPFARFEPTEGGWNAAKRLAEYYGSE